MGNGFSFSSEKQKFIKLRYIEVPEMLQFKAAGLRPLRNHIASLFPF